MIMTNLVQNKEEIKKGGHIKRVKKSRLDLKSL